MSKDRITLHINGKRITTKKGLSILEIARKKGIEIPALCYHPDLPVKANCRLCLVEIEGRQGLLTACSTPAENGMKIKTKSPEITRARKINVELLYAQHSDDCIECKEGHKCELEELAKKYNIHLSKFPNRKTGKPSYQFGPCIIYDSSKCIDCRNCVDVCEKQCVDFYDVKEYGAMFQIFPTKDKKKNCIFCGQCITHCPVGAIETVSETKEIEAAIKNKKQTVVFQFAPSIRTSIGEEFDMKHGEVVTNQIVAAIKKLGADKVFDVSVAADFTTTEEAYELVERIKKKLPLPMFTSCCPSWVRYLELNHKKLIPNLTTARSPNMMGGGLIKTYWAEKEKIDPKKITVVAVMPCTAKKYEILRPEYKIDGLMPVDHVVTTRELAALFKKHKINLKKVKPVKCDNPLGIPTGAGVIYGASGGVMESALRTAHELITEKPLGKVEFKQVRGQEGFKTAEVAIKGKKIRVAVVNGIENAETLLQELKKDPNKYHYIEVMACFGGCIGGGGQPIPTNSEIRKLRAQSLYKLDTKSKYRSGHKNPIVVKIYKDYLTNKKKIHHIFHTHFSPKSSTCIKKTS